MAFQHSENEDHGIQSHHFMGNRWGNSGNSVRLYFGGAKIIADDDCSHEIKRHLLLGRKVMTNLDSWKKHKLESRLLGEISITSDMQMTLPLWQKVKKN